MEVGLVVYFMEQDMVTWMMNPSVFYMVYQRDIQEAGTRNLTEMSAVVNAALIYRNNGKPNSMTESWEMHTGSDVAVKSAKCVHQNEKEDVVS